MVKVTKAWRVCRTHTDATTRVKASSDNTELGVPLDESTKPYLAEAWKVRHHFTLADTRLLADTLQGRLYREVTSQPPRMSVYFLEQLRISSSLSRKYNIALLAQPNEAAKGTDIILDQVGGSIAIFLRGRALFSTIAYVSVHNQQWLSLDDAEFAADKLLQLINQEFNGRRAPMNFYVGAWSATMQRWSEQVRTSGQTLGCIVRQTAACEHLWTLWYPASASLSGSSTAPVADNT